MKTCLDQRVVAESSDANRQKEPTMTPARRHSLFAAVLAGLLATSATLAEVRAVALPTGFEGRYAPEGVACEALAVITIDGGVMVGGEFAITVTDLIEDKDNPRKVEATLFNEGGGGEWTDSAVLTLADDEQSLQFDYPDGATVTWLRCD
jgi:hypothetical protein